MWVPNARLWTRTSSEAGGPDEGLFWAGNLCREYGISHFMGLTNTRQSAQVDPFRVTQVYELGPYFAPELQVVISK